MRTCRTDTHAYPSTPGPPTALPRAHLPLASSLYLLPLKPSNSLKELSTHALSTSSPSARSSTYSRLNSILSNSFIHSFIHQQHIQHHIRWVPRGTFLWSRSPAPSQSLNPMDTGFYIMHSLSSIHELLRMHLNSPGRIRRLPGHVPSALAVTPPTAGSPPTSLLAPSQVPASSADFYSLNCCSASGLSGLNSLFSHPLLHIRTALVLPKLLMPGPHL